MGDVVIVAYRPKPGREADLLALTRTHVPELRALRLATDRPATTMQAKDGTVVEVFEWQDGAIARAPTKTRRYTPCGRASRKCATTCRSASCPNHTTCSHNLRRCSPHRACAMRATRLPAYRFGPS